MVRIKDAVERGGINIPIDSGKGGVESSQYRDRFIVTCVKELKYLGKCICFTEEHLKLIKERLGEDSIKYERKEDFYYEVTYVKNDK